MRLHRYIRGDSLVYGLGIPFLALSGRVSCYSRSGFYVLDGLGYKAAQSDCEPAPVPVTVPEPSAVAIRGPCPCPCLYPCPCRPPPPRTRPRYVPPAEMASAGVDTVAIRKAAVLHYNGDRKPWGGHAFPEYIDAMGDWGQLHGPGRAFFAASSPASAHDGGGGGGDGARVKPLKLVVLLSGPRTGTEWLAKVMADDGKSICGSLSERSAPHPEALMPFEVPCANASEVPCTAWAVERLTTDSCDLRRMCHWRYVIGAARGAYASQPAPAGGGASGSAAVHAFAHRWHVWGANRSATDVFEGYLRRLMRLETTAPELPCRCEASQGYLFLKFFLTWLEPPKSSLPMPDNTYQRRFLPSWRAAPADADGSPTAWAKAHLVTPHAVFRRLKAKVSYRRLTFPRASQPVGRRAQSPRAPRHGRPAHTRTRVPCVHRAGPLHAPRPGRPVLVNPTWPPRRASRGRRRGCTWRQTWDGGEGMALLRERPRKVPETPGRRLHLPRQHTRRRFLCGRIDPSAGPRLRLQPAHLALFRGLHGQRHRVRRRVVRRRVARLQPPHSRLLRLSALVSNRSSAHRR